MFCAYLFESDLEPQVTAVGSLVEAAAHSWPSGMRDLHMTGMVGEVAVADGTLVSSWALRPDNNLGHFLCTGSFQHRRPNLNLYGRCGIVLAGTLSEWS